MEKYILLDAVMAEIEKIKENAKKRGEIGKISTIVVCNELLDRLNDLEVNEEDSTDAFIEKAVSYIQQHWIWNTKIIEDFRKHMKGE